MEIAFAKLATQGVTVDCFDCGENALNHFLVHEAADFGAKGLSATKLLVERETMRAVGFYSISPFCLARHFLADEQLSYYDVPFPIPAWLIGRLAVDSRYQGIGLGALLLHDAIVNIRSRAYDGAGALVIVDAKNRVVRGFYRKYGFRSLNQAGLKLARPIAEA
ncbi:MAG: GNAT family N-acetyltransferase [Akkermansia sp.]|nr:GNAT family N-acetyltransferase [Akkermansia sp.]